jgi:Tol biopolymer transport system component
MSLRLGDSTAQPVVANPNFDEFGAHVSPDGSLIAYVSDESGRPEVYVRELQDPGAGRTQVSVNGGEEPRWAHNGRELFYRTRRGDFMVAERAPGAEFRVARLSTLFSNSALLGDNYHRMYDVDRSDNRFLMSVRALGGRSQVVVVSDWRLVERAARGIRDQ